MLDPGRPLVPYVAHPAERSPRAAPTIEPMAKQPTRRDAIKTVAAGLAVPAVGSAAATPLVQIVTAYQPRNITSDQFRLVTTLVEMIIPETDTPGAAAAGVDRIIDETLGRNLDRRAKFRQGLALLEAEKFSDRDKDDQVRLLTEFSNGDGEKGKFFTLLKDLTVDGYYSTEIGMVRELGYRGNTFLKEFPGCTHEEHQ